MEDIKITLSPKSKSQHSINLSLPRMGSINSNNKKIVTNTNIKITSSKKLVQNYDNINETPIKTYSLKIFWPI